MTDEIACVYRYFLFCFDYQYEQDMQDFKRLQNRSNISSINSVHHILLKLNGMKYRQIGATTRAKALHDKAFEIVRFMAKYS